MTAPQAESFQPGEPARAARAAEPALGGMTVGIVGLGAMGAPTVRHLAAAGVPVVVHDLDPERTAAAARDGAEVAGGLADLAARADVVLVVVPSDADVRTVCLGTAGTAATTGTGTDSADDSGPGSTSAGDGLLAAMRPDAVLVVCSSVHPSTVRDLDAAAGAGPAVLDAALTGGVRAADEGTINLLVGGPAEALDRIRPVLAPWCASVHHLGPLGAGQVAKSANNLVHWAQICAIEEALDLARRHGLSVPAVRAALMSGPTDSRTLRELERMRLTWWAKDLESIDRLGAEVDRDLPVARMCAQRMPGITVDSLRELLDASS